MSIKKYREFLRDYETKAEDLKEKIIGDLHNRILPGIRDILSTYQDDQDRKIVASVQDNLYRRSVTGRDSLDTQIGNLYICVYCEGGITPIRNVKDILKRILSEFGEDIKIDPKVIQKVEDLYEPTRLDFFLV